MAMNIGLEIRLLRERRGMTSKDLASRLGLSQSQMSRLEKGQRRIDAGLLNRVAEALGVAPAFFFGDAPPPAAPLPQTPDLGRVLRQQRHIRHMSAEDLAKRIGKPRSWILAFEAGEDAELDQEVLSSICKALKVDPAVFFEAQQDMIRSLSAQVDRLASTHSRESLPSVSLAAGAAGGAERKAIPVLNSVAAGYPLSFGPDGMPLGEVHDAVYVEGCAEPGAFALTVCGDRMASDGPVSFKEGDLVVFSGRREVLSRDFAFAHLRSQPPEIAQVYFDPGGKARLSPLNRNYAPLSVDRAEILRLWRAVARIERI